MTPLTPHVSSLVRKELRLVSAHPLQSNKDSRFSELNITRDLDTWAPYPELWSTMIESLYCEYLLNWSGNRTLKPNNFLATRGSTEGLELLIRCFCAPYVDSVAVTPPTFPKIDF